MENLLQHIVDEAAKRGHDVSIRNIAYALFRVKFNDASIALTIINGATPKDESEISAYDNMDKVQFLIHWFEKDLAPNDNGDKNSEDIINAIKKNNEHDDSVDGSMSFGENRAGIETQIAEILELKKQLIDEDGKCTDVKTMATLQRTEADLRSKLNDKFGASEKSDQNYVAVLTRCNHICEWTNRECWLQTKEYAMEKWNLIEKE